jgi:hypothetical protein
MISDPIRVEILLPSAIRRYVSLTIIHTNVVFLLLAVVQHNIGMLILLIMHYLKNQCH